MRIKTITVKVLLCNILLLANSSFLLANIVVLNGLTHEQTSNSGGVYKGTIEIQNSGNEEKSVKVYLKDYIFNYKGESMHDEPGTVGRSNSSWITFNPELMNLEAGEKATIDYEVRVPDADSLKGTYWSVIMVEGVTPPDTMVQTKGVTINTTIRYAVQIVTHIGNTGISDLQFAGLELVKGEQGSLINVIIENTGERQLKPELAIELFDENGSSVGVVKAESRKTFPGTSISVTLDLAGIEPGRYTGVVVADCDEDHVFGTNVSFELE